MLNRIVDLGQAAVQSGTRAMRLLLDFAMMASDHLRQKVGLGSPEQERYDTRPIPPPSPAPAPAPAGEAAQAKAAQAQGAAGQVKQAGQRARSGKPASSKKKPVRTTRPKSAAKSRKKTRGGGAKRPDQMVRVLELLAAGSKTWMSAKELSDAGEAAGKPILPGNVRKVIRARGKDLVETRPRKGSRRGAMEYRITAAGRKKLEE